MREEYQRKVAAWIKNRLPREYLEKIDTQTCVELIHCVTDLLLSEREEMAFDVARNMQRSRISGAKKVDNEFMRELEKL